MGEGLSTAEVGNEISHHKKHHAAHDGEQTGHDRIITIIEAILLAVVAILAAWSGFAASQWSTESRLALAQASTARTEASETTIEAMEQRNFDSSTFDAWFTAYVAGNAEAMEIAERRFRPEFEVAFDAWIATEPATNSDAPPGPTYVEEYEQPLLDEADSLSEKADDLYDEGAEAAKDADDYVRTTVYLATVLFLVGISGHFRVRAARIGLVAIGGIVLTLAVVALVSLPTPPT